MCIIGFELYSVMLTFSDLVNKISSQQNREYLHKYLFTTNCGYNYAYPLLHLAWRLFATRLYPEILIDGSPTTKNKYTAWITKTIISQTFRWSRKSEKKNLNFGKVALAVLIQHTLMPRKIETTCKHCCCFFSSFQEKINQFQLENWNIFAPSV